MELTPASDTWVDTARLQAKIIQTEGNYAATLDNMVRNDGVDPQTGMGPIMWNSWETTWTGTTTNDFEGASTQTVNDTVTWSEGGWVNQEPSTNPARWVTATVNTTTRNWFRETIQTGTESRTGLRNIVTETFDEQSVGDRVVSREVVPFMRSRNIEFVAKKVKPLTQLYGFFDGEDVTKYCVPKLIEISMTSGTFQVGEQIHAHRATSTFEHSFNCRVAQSNHKEGPYNVPTKTFRDNPYTNQPLSSNYSSTSDILNVDTYSLSNQPQGQYYGRIETGMVLKGLSSKAQATVTNVRLISDVSAFCAGSFYIPDPNSINHPRFETGTKVFTLTSEPDNDANKATTLTDETFTAAGTLETVQENILSIRNARVEQRQEFQERNVEESLGTTLVGQDTTTTQGDRRINSWYDPLAQSFLVEDDNGIFITKCDVFFRTKDDMDVPCVFQLRSMLNGFPTQHILPFSEIVLAPDDVITSADGSVATTVNFRAPVYLEGGNTEYAICLASNSTKYSVYISRIGETDLLTDTFISNQPYLGSLFKSQNASTWEPSQWEDLKFTLYRAEFETA